MYEGKMYETFIDKDPIIHNHAIYWDEEVGYEITKSNRLALSRPTVTIHIPLKQLKLEKVDTTSLDYIYRSFLPYIQELNELNDNRKRTPKENGHYFIYEPNHKVLVRNVITTRIVSQRYYELMKKDTIQPFDGRESVPAYLCASIMLQVQLPEGKHKKAIQMLTKDLPDADQTEIRKSRDTWLKRKQTLLDYRRLLLFTVMQEWMEADENVRNRFLGMIQNPCEFSI